MADWPGGVPDNLETMRAAVVERTRSGVTSRASMLALADYIGALEAALAASREEVRRLTLGRDKAMNLARYCVKALGLANTYLDAFVWVTEPEMTELRKIKRASKKAKEQYAIVNERVHGLRPWAALRSPESPSPAAVGVPVTPEDTP